jgi:hypothetical protein
MTFWSVQLGPYYEGDARGDESMRGHRCIGEVVCPDCGNVMGGSAPTFVDSVG